MSVVDEYRQRQPLVELERKAKKARRPGWWTQEDIDLAKAEARNLVKFFERASCLS